MNKETIIQAATGQGKSYQTALNALFLAVMQTKLVIISTSTKILVDQYITELEKISDKKIYSILNEIKQKSAVYSDSYVLEFSLFLKKTEDSNFFPFGMECILKNNIGLQNLSNSDIVFLSANFSTYNLMTHAEHNKQYYLLFQFLKVYFFQS